MSETKTVTIIELALSAVAFALGFIGRSAARSQIKQQGESKKLKKRARMCAVLMIIAAWFFVGTVLTGLWNGKAELNVEFQMFSERVSLLGFSVSKTGVLMWIITAVVLALCLVFRFALFPKFDKDRPASAFQNVMELAVESMENFTKGIVGEYAGELAPYMFTLAVFMIFCAASELIGRRPPTSDLTVTLAMGLITFVLINVYGIRKKGVGGRLSSLAKPVPVIFPMKILSDIAVPISLACRLFGNMVGGMIVMDLLRSVLGGYASGIPAVAGLYFNLFHPVIQAYIFIILSLTFINEAVE